MIVHFKSAFLAVFVLLSPLAAAESQAQTSTTTSAPMMWGTTPGGISVLGAVDSAIAHAQNGVVASQVNAAQRGILLGSNVTIQTIGSQTVMQSTINGNGNTSSLSGTQTSTNSGSVNNNGSIGR